MPGLGCGEPVCGFGTRAGYVGPVPVWTVTVGGKHSSSPIIELNLLEGLPQRGGTTQLVWEEPGPSVSLPFQNCLRMVATQPIPKGHEIFNTYGKMANWQLIHMYGFVEPYPDNTDDTADIQMVTVREAALQGEQLTQSWVFGCASVPAPGALLQGSLFL